MVARLYQCHVISIHAPRVGSDQHSADHSPAKRISIHAPRVGSDAINVPSICRFTRISIHAPRVGSDPGREALAGAQGNFNPRSPCGERLSVFHRLSPNERFQSTLPVWGATERFSVLFHLFVISIHAPRVGSDSSTPCNPVITMLFQSTLPVWGATVWGSFFFGGENISIHAPRVGSDWLPGDTSPPQGDFNPRSPCGERQRERLSFRFVYGFQSTLPVWGATCLDAKCAGVGVHFNPRSPCGERHNIVSIPKHQLDFNPRSPCGERP